MKTKNLYDKVYNAVYELKKHERETGDECKYILLPHPITWEVIQWLDKLNRNKYELKCNKLNLKN